MPSSIAPPAVAKPADPVPGSQPPLPGAAKCDRRFFYSEHIITPACQNAKDEVLLDTGSVKSYFQNTLHAQVVLLDKPDKAHSLQDRFAQVFERVSAVPGVDADTTVVFHLIGLGLLPAAKKGRKPTLDFATVRTQTSVVTAFLRKLRDLGDVPYNILLLVDTCNAGQFVQALASDPVLCRRRVAAQGACLADQLAPSAKPQFVKCWLEAQKGKATVATPYAATPCFWASPAFRCPFAFLGTQSQ